MAGCPQSSLITLGRGLPPCLNEPNPQFHQGMSASVASLGGRRGFLGSPFFIVLLCRRGTPVPCSVGTHCGIHLLLPLVKCDILLVVRLTDPLQGQAPSHYLSGPSAAHMFCLLPPFGCGMQEHFMEDHKLVWGFLDPTWDTHPGRDPTLPFIVPPERRFLLALPYGRPPGFFPSCYHISIQGELCNYRKRKTMNNYGKNKGRI